jgi:AcrR family transcriptional regulator
VSEPPQGSSGSPAARPGVSIRDRIIEVAREELATSGLAAMTIRRVARETGVDPGTVRHYFPGKDALAMAAVRPERDFAEAIGQIVEELGPGVSTGAVVVEAASQLIPFGELGRAAIAVCLNGGDYDSTALADFHRAVVLPASGGAAVEDRDERAALVMAALIGTHLMDIVWPDRGLTEARARGMLAAALDHYLS